MVLGADFMSHGCGKGDLQAKKNGLLHLLSAFCYIGLKLNLEDTQKKKNRRLSFCASKSEWKVVLPCF